MCFTAAIIKVVLYIVVNIIFIGYFLLFFFNLFISLETKDSTGITDSGF